MKKSIFLFALAFSTVTYGQNIILKPGQEIKIKSTTQQNTQLSMGMEIAGNVETIYKVHVNRDLGTTYEMDGLLDKMKMQVDAMGRQETYNSDSASDKNSDIGHAVGSYVGKKGVYTLNKKTADVTVIKQPDIDTSNINAGMAGLMNDLQLGTDKMLKIIFLPALANHKPGDKWADSTTAEGMKNVNQYTYQSVSGGIAKVLLHTTVSGIMHKEAQGVQLEIKMNSENNGTMDVDSKSYLVKTSTLDSNANGQTNLMGQDVTITAKVHVKLETE